MIKKIGKVLTGQPDDKDSYPLPTFVSYNDFDKPLPTKSMDLKKVGQVRKLTPEDILILRDIEPFCIYKRSINDEDKDHAKPESD